MGTKITISFQNLYREKQLCGGGNPSFVVALTLHPTSYGPPRCRKLGMSRNRLTCLIICLVPDGVSSHDTSSVAAEPFHVLHMDPMSDVSMCNQVLVAHLCHPMLYFVLLLRGKFGRFEANPSSPN